MSGINRATLTGNAGKNAELRFTSTGKAKIEFSMATTQTWKDERGEKKTSTQWHNCVVWGKRAEALARMILKGTRLFVEGRIEYRSWDKDDGTKGYRTEINVTELDLLAPPRTSSREEGAPAGHKAMDEIDPGPPGDDVPLGPPPTTEDDIPF